MSFDRVVYSKLCDTSIDAYLGYLHTCRVCYGVPSTVDVGGEADSCGRVDVDDGECVVRSVVCGSECRDATVGRDVVDSVCDRGSVTGADGSTGGAATVVETCAEDVEEGGSVAECVTGGVADARERAVCGDDCGSELGDGGTGTRGAGELVRGKHWRRNLARRRAKQRVRREESSATASLCDKWIAQNDLAAFKARRELEVLRSQELSSVVRMRAAKVTAATELAKVKIEKAFSTLSKTGSAYVPGLSDGGSISPGSSASMAEYRAVQKRNIDLEARVCELEGLLSAGSKPSCDLEGLTVDSQGNYDLDAARALAGSVYGGAYLANGRFDPLAQVEDNMDFYSYNDGSN